MNEILMRHEPVLLQEVIEQLQLKKGMNVIDCTVGDGGHSEAILTHIGTNGTLLAIDVDPESLLRAKQFLYMHRDHIIFVRDNFKHLTNIVEHTQLHPINAIVMDFGWSTPQFAERGRGFSFQTDEPLDMRYSAGDDEQLTAKDIINNWNAEELVKIFTEYAEEPNAVRIVKEIEEVRKKQIIETTGQLVEIILSALRKKFNTSKEVPWVGGLHPATKVFQALRIAVNNELDVIETVLPQAINILAPGGRLAVITFHSLEDRIAKHFFKKHSDLVRICTKKPIVAGDSEYKSNPRARSAKLRVVEKI